MEIKERIIAKAGDLFFQYGIKSVSMDEMAFSLGISKRTIYENFKDKEEILLSLLMDLRDKRRHVFDSLISNTPNVVEIFIKIIEIQQSAPICNAKFFEDIQKYYPHANEFIENDVDKNKESLVKFLQNGIRQGYIREDLNVEVTAFLVEQSSSIYIRATSLEKPPFTFAELFYTMMINFVRGILTEKGIKIIDDYLAQQKEKNRLKNDE
ncbi:MAG: TetR/AcrR family transcriptional regulator [Proteiniphilum sp.]|jgi:AcrR family transcriptional regulator|nr:TetR/AcrR family transcriptional regulator [Proteiniphilum sp.]MDD2938221.1 TetR/AcrR family transcriptional regulator [Proteiniphilum sp.]MDD3075842.1 TetR/AcrR family transcriptional regulator [Proteiniphilum sp.]MDD3779282.1 TetR/AcrR family transcriptional regulator [Proteiniphilum sp.]MDD3955221.1 TetR/AcrR family transcriptional regulator [Proteiniphilum sp.]